MLTRTHHVPPRVAWYIAAASSHVALSPAAKRIASAAAVGAACARPQLACAALESLCALAVRHAHAALVPRAWAAAMRARRSARDGDVLAHRSDEVAARLAAKSLQAQEQDQEEGLQEERERHRHDRPGREMAAAEARAGVSAQ